jgi:hypothetical protein
LVLGADDGEERPLAEALQLVDASRFELDPGPGNEILDGSRDEHFAFDGLAGDAGADVDGEP